MTTAIIERKKIMNKLKMTASEAFVETLVAEGVDTVFGIVGSAYMEALDLFPDAGIRFVSVAHFGQYIPEVPLLPAPGRRQHELPPVRERPKQI